MDKTRPSEYFLRFAHFCGNHSEWILSAILLLSLVIRIAALLSLKQSVYFNHLISDEGLYHEWALSIANGTFQSSMVYEFAPLPAYLQALVYKLLSPNVIYIRFLNILFNIITCSFIYAIGRELSGNNTGLLAALMASLYEPFILYSIVPLKTSLSILLFALSAYYFVRALQHRPSLWRSVAAGLSIGLSINVRPHTIVLIPFMFAIMVWFRYRDTASLKRSVIFPALFAAGVVLALLPFSIRNTIKADTFALTTSQSGFHLYLYNNVQYPDNFVPFATNSAKERGVQFTIEACRRVNRKLSPTEASNFWKKETFREIMQNPAAAIKKTAKKTGVFFSWFESDNHYQVNFMSRVVPFFKLPFLPLWFVLSLGLTGMVAVSTSIRARAGLTLMFLFYSATLIIFYTYTRIRLPVMAIVIPFASAGIVRLIQNISEKQVAKITAYAVTLLIFLGLAFFPNKYAGDFSGQYNTYASAMANTGRQYSRALKLLKLSSDMNGRSSAYANLALARRHLKLGEVDKVIHYLDKIPPNSFAIAQRYDLYGDLMMKLGQSDRAARSYEKALEINSGLRKLRKKLIKLYIKTDLEKAREHRKKLDYIEEFYKLY